MKTRQDKTGQEETRQDDTKQDETRQDETRHEGISRFEIKHKLMKTVVGLPLLEAKTDDFCCTYIRPRHS